MKCRPNAGAGLAGLYCITRFTRLAFPESRKRRQLMRAISGKPPTLIFVPEQPPLPPPESPPLQPEASLLQTGDTAIERLAIKAKSLPHRPGVYLMKDAEGRVIYVGKAGSLR